jgi:hypothetical protein
MNDINLARDPFRNRRPILRAAALLWGLSLGLLALNGWLYWQHFVGQGQQEEELASLEPKVAEQRQLLDQAVATLESFDLDWQRQQVAFLNARIAERTFSWSALFDDLSQVLPRNVRIGRVTPHLASSPARGSRGTNRAPGDEVVLDLSGSAEEDDALLVLLDAFFAHERFRRPKLEVEARRSGGDEVTFTMTVVYQPATPVPAKRQEGVEAVGEDEDDEPVAAPAGRVRS